MSALLRLALASNGAGLWSSWVPEPNTGCFLWTGRQLRSGHGILSIAGGAELAHRLVYRLLIDEVGQRDQVHHVCRQPACINPAHLISLTAQQHREVHTGKALAWLRIDPAIADPLHDGYLSLQGWVAMRRHDLGVA